MIEFLLIRVSIWFAMGTWLLGVACRMLANRGRLPNGQIVRNWIRVERCYYWSWLVSGIATWIHVVAAYGFVHGWDHSEALRHTGEESFQMTGLRAPWGVYVNFVYAGVLLFYSSIMLWIGRRVPIADAVIFWFTAFIMFNATVVFKTGVLRLIASLCFSALILTSGFAILSQRKRQSVVN